MSETAGWNAGTVAEFRANEGRVGGVFAGLRSAIAASATEDEGQHATQPSPRFSPRLTRDELVVDRLAGRRHPVPEPGSLGHHKAPSATSCSTAAPKPVRLRLVHPPLSIVKVTGAPAAGPRVR